jgi:hypothetical protein
MKCRRSRCRSLGLCCLVLLAGCAEQSTQPGSEAPAAVEAESERASTVTPEGARFTIDEVRAQADRLTKQMEFPAVRRAEIEERLDKLLGHDDLRATFERQGIGAVAAYRLGEGGAVVKVTNGDGILAVPGSETPRKFAFKSTSFGAVVGGSAGWGVVLFVGLVGTDMAPGKYRGSVKGATAIDESSGVSKFDHETAGHSIYFVGTATGLSANAGKAKLTFAYEDE